MRLFGLIVKVGAWLTAWYFLTSGLMDRLPKSQVLVFIVGTFAGVMVCGIWKACSTVSRNSVAPRSPRERRMCAVHEAGHVVAAWFNPSADEIAGVDIRQTRSRGGTTRMNLRSNATRNQLVARMSTYLGGRVAEKIVFGEMTVGLESDLENATDVAKKMVMELGMSEKLGARFFAEDDRTSYGASAVETIDAEVRRLVDEAERLAERVISERRRELDKLANVLEAVVKLKRGELAKVLGPQELE